MKSSLLLTTIMVLCLSGFAQIYDTVTISQIQFVSQQDLGNCVDATPYLGDTVWTHGTVMMDGGLAQVVSGRNVWLQSGPGPFNGIDLYTIGVPTPVPGDDVLDLSAGDSVEVLGVIITFGNETEIAPLEINVIGFGRTVYVNPVSVGDLNDNQRINLPETGEQWEGQYVEITDVTVTSVDLFAGGSRVSFNASDANGNTINVSDRFIAQRLPANGGTFVAPNVGTVYDTIRGVIVHSANGCFGANGRGYELFPFRSEDYVVRAGFSAPLISGTTRNPISPSPSQDVNVSATIDDVDGTVTSASLFYAVGVGNPTYFSVPMTASGSTYTGTIPSTAFSDGDLVKYYVCATDNDNLTACNPDVGGGVADPLFFFVRDGGLTTIYDVQFAPFSTDNSGYVNLDVTLRGIVTATSSSNDLGFVYIQQPGENQWAGLPLTQNQSLNALQRGDEVEVSGTIIESFDMTTMIVQSASTISTGNALPDAIELDPSLFSSYSVAGVEPYESMVVKLVGDNGDPLYVVDENADDPSNFAEYRVGKDPFDPNAGSRVLAGRVTGSAFSSLAFSYINDILFSTDFGIMTVDPCVITVGDSMESLSGIMYHSFGAMKLLPRNNDDAVGYKGENCPDGISDLESTIESHTLTVYPNPAREQVTLRYDLSSRVVGQVVLTDMMGRSLATKALEGTVGEISFQTNHLPAGTYLISIRTDREILSRHKVVLID